MKLVSLSMAPWERAEPSVGVLARVGALKPFCAACKEVDLGGLGNYLSLPFVILNLHAVEQGWEAIAPPLLSNCALQGIYGVLVAAHLRTLATASTYLPTYLLTVKPAIP